MLFLFYLITIDIYHVTTAQDNPFMERGLYSDISITTLRQTVPRAVHLVWTMAPGWTVLNVILISILGILPLAGLYLTKLIVDTVTNGLGTPDISVVFNQVLILILIAAGVALAIAVARSVSELVSEAQSTIVTDGVSDILHAQSLTVDLEYYEEADYYDSLHRAQREAPYRPARIVNGLVQIGQGTHKELLQMNGKYAQLFRTQARQYKVELVDEGSSNEKF
jgi:ABC-type multidrug transport system fused ATPase/permease subunit